MNAEVKVGDYLYRMIYLGNSPSLQKRSISKRKIQKVTKNYAILVQKERVPLSQVDNDYTDNWYTSRKLMYQGKLKAYLNEYKYVLDELDYLKKKVNSIQHNNNKKS